MQLILPLTVIHTRFIANHPQYNLGNFAKNLGRSCFTRQIQKDVSNSSSGLCLWYRQNTYLEKMRKTSNSQDRRTSAHSLISECFFDERVAFTELWFSGSQCHSRPVNREVYSTNGCNVS
jgi:hypothetical protein